MKALSKPGANRVLKEADGRILLELKTAVDRSADIDEQAHVQGQIGFVAEIQNGLRRLVIVENREIGLVEVANKLAMLIGGDEKNVDLVHSFVDGEQSALGIVVRSSGVGADAGRAAGIILGKRRRCAG